MAAEGFDGTLSDEVPSRVVEVEVAMLLEAVLDDGLFGLDVDCRAVLAVATLGSDIPLVLPSAVL